jgi:hypothetical protein
MALEWLEGLLSADALAKGFQTVPLARARGRAIGTSVDDHGRTGTGQEESAVARYYFDVQDGKPLVRDDEGAEFDSLDAAVQAAARSAAEIGTGRLARGDTSDVVIEVRDEQDRRVCTVTASMRIERHGPFHHGPHAWSA